MADVFCCWVFVNQSQFSLLLTDNYKWFSLAGEKGVKARSRLSVAKCQLKLRTKFGKTEAWLRVAAAKIPAKLGINTGETEAYVGVAVAKIPAKIGNQNWEKCEVQFGVAACRFPAKMGEQNWGNRHRSGWLQSNSQWILKTYIGESEAASRNWEPNLGETKAGRADSEVCSNLLAIFQVLAGKLGVPLADGKTEGPSTKLSHLGLR